MNFWHLGREQECRRERGRILINANIERWKRTHLLVGIISFPVVHSSTYICMYVRHIPRLSEIQATRIRPNRFRWACDRATVIEFYFKVALSVPIRIPSGWIFYTIYHFRLCVWAYTMKKREKRECERKRKETRSNATFRKHLRILFPSGRCAADGPLACTSLRKASSQCKNWVASFHFFFRTKRLPSNAREITFVVS